MINVDNWHFCNAQFIIFTYEICIALPLQPVWAVYVIGRASAQSAVHERSEIDCRAACGRGAYLLWSGRWGESECTFFNVGGRHGNQMFFYIFWAVESKFHGIHARKLSVLSLFNNLVQKWRFPHILMKSISMIHTLICILRRRGQISSFPGAKIVSSFFI